MEAKYTLDGNKLVLTQADGTTETSTVKITGNKMTLEGPSGTTTLTKVP